MRLAVARPRVRRYRFPRRKAAARLPVSGDETFVSIDVNLNTKKMSRISSLALYRFLCLQQ